MYGMKGNIFDFFFNGVPLSILLAKASFAFLLISMFSYWFQVAFKYIKIRALAKLPLATMYSANLTLAVLLLLRWIESGHFPLSNLYESLVFLSWSLTSIHLILENMLRKTNKGNQVAPFLNLGAITSPLCLFTNAFATFSLPQEMQKVTVLVPALQSNWLIMHVSVMIISYAALLSGSLLAMAFLVSKFVEETKISGNILISFKNAASSVSFNRETAFNTFGTVFGKPSLFQLDNNKGITTTLLPPSENVEIQNKYRLESSKVVNELVNSQVNKSINVEKNLSQLLDNLSYRSISLGFALLTIGILSGAVWANEAWGSYWNWDPKETWAFVTWLVFAFYLHTRLSKGWIGKESAFVAIFGFAIIWFCYLGVNLFGKGLHSYGWFHTNI